VIPKTCQRLETMDPTDFPCWGAKAKEVWQDQAERGYDGDQDTDCVAPPSQSSDKRYCNLEREGQ
jgi:hypothetical protein